MNFTIQEALLFAGEDFKTFNLDGLEINKDLAIQSIAEDLVDDFHDLNSKEVISARVNHFNITGVSEDHFKERIINLGGGKKVICGIRHKGGDFRHPFIQITPNFDIQNYERQKLYDEYFKSYFSIFEPLHIRFWSKKYTENCMIGSVYLVSDMSQVRSIPKWESEDNITFVNVEDNSYYPWYESLYKDFHKKEPSLKHRVTVNSEEEMETSIKEGLLKVVFLNDERIGLIAGERSKLLGHEGIFFNEILISPKYTGKGLAKAVQRKFLVEFSRPEDLVWGTVDYQNKPSYKTALSNGRKPVRFESFVKIDNK